MAPIAKTQPAKTQTTKPQTANLFMNGRSQAVRLPREFRFKGREVAIRRDLATGEVVLAPLPSRKRALTFDQWFALYDAIPDDASEEEFSRLPPPPKNLTMEQRRKIFDRTTYPADFFERHTSMPRELDLF
jgi:antitoxin VapB